MDPDLRGRVAAMQRRAFELAAGAPGSEDLEIELEPAAIDRLAEITVPTLVVAGALDQPTVIDTAAWLANELPDVRLELVPGVGHFLPMEVPDGFAELVIDFVAGRSFAERALLAAELVSVGRRLEGEGIYNGGKLARAAADRDSSGRRSSTI